MALQGTLDTFALPDVLRLLAATKKTGRLRITGGRGTGSVWVTAGDIVGVEATHAPHATGAVDALFELLRFHEGAFTFDAEAVAEDPGPPSDVESLLGSAEAMLDEWRSIEAVVPSLDAWVTLAKTLPSAQATVDQDAWTTIVAVGSGATVRRIGDELCLPELPVSRAIKGLVDADLVDIAASAPAGSLAAGGSTPVATTPTASAASSAPIEPAPRPLVAPDIAEPEAAPATSGPRARRARAAAEAPAEPEVFVPLDLPVNGSGSYDEPDAAPTPDLSSTAMDDLAAAFPGLANRVAEPATEEDAELAKQLATLSPRAATAIKAAAEAATVEERDAALDEAEGEDQPLNRGLLLKFLSSVKS